MGDDLESCILQESCCSDRFCISMSSDIFCIYLVDRRLVADLDSRDSILSELSDLCLIDPVRSRLDRDPDHSTSR